jgi:hypothetical protein
MNTETTPAAVNITVRISPESHKKACELAAHHGYANISELAEYLLEKESERVGIEE